MRTIAWETDSQRALRYCSKEVKGKISIKCEFSEGRYV